MMPRRSYLVYFLEAVVFTGLLWNYSLISYGMMQLKGQLDIILNARPVEEVLADAAVPDSVKYKLRLIEEIRDFAVEELGINPSENYTTYYDQKGKPVLWVLTACEPYEMKAYEWKFPVLGVVSYKGFFKEDKGLREQEIIQKMGLDGELGKAGAWSTLGYFRDPVLSDMIAYSEGNLANLIIHELTHGTLYVKGDVDFNENLASFIGDKGALLFLEHRFGKASDEMKKYLQERHDDQIYSDYIISSAEKLKSFYERIRDAAAEEKKQKKQQALDEIIKGIKDLPLLDGTRYLKAEERIKKQKNAYFMSFIRYNSKLDEFEKELQENFGNDLKKYLNHLKEIYPSV
jgi:predicted aminopeptidase